MTMFYSVDNELHKLLFLIIAMEETTTKPVTINKPAATSPSAQSPHNSNGNRKNMRMIYIGLSVLILMVIIWVVSMRFGNPNKSTEIQKANTTPVKVGVMLPLTGGLASTGTRELQGVQLAIKQLD